MMVYRARLISGLLFFTLVFSPLFALGQDEGDLPPEEVETAFEDGVPPLPPDDGGGGMEDEPPIPTDDFRRAPSPGGGSGGGSRPSFTRGGGGGGDGFGSSKKKVEFRLVEEGNPRYNTNRKPRFDRKFPR
ncbi:MAG: hypothetical protein KDD68_08090 [Bdellovibrionales bacterium]|nr:hypothetical protein [Bdellovibrionales bacterium]